MKRTPHQRIRDAFKRGTSCRLSVEDVETLGMDDAITTRASWDDLSEEQRRAENQLESSAFDTRR